MPPAGAVIPPQILPLRKPVIGIPSSHIDINTYIELETETPDCRIFFTTDGSKPEPFQRTIGGTEYTFKYRGPFTLKPGKRTLKVIAVTRDGFRQSNVVTKTFTVQDGSEPHELDDPVDQLFETSSVDFSSSDLERAYSSSVVPARRSNSRTRHSNKVKKLKTSDNLAVREAWGNTTEDYMKPSPAVISSSYDDLTKQSTNSVQMPEDGTWAPTNYSGTQINFWGCAPNTNPGAWAAGGAPGAGGYTGPYANYPSQLGLMTQKMLSGLEGPKISLDELKKLYANQQQTPPPPPPQPQIQWKEPELTDVSPGNGDWKGQLAHIYAHLIKNCEANGNFRNKIGEPKLGKIMHAEFDEEDDVYLLTVSLAKHGHKPKPKPVPIKKAPPSPTIKKPPSPKPQISTIAKAAVAAKKLAPKKKPEEPPKEPPKPPVKKDAYIVAEEYQADPTLVPWETFDAEMDAEKLRAAMKGVGTDEKTIIDTLGYRTSGQRQEVVKMFKTMFGKDLRDELSGETSGNFKTALKALCMPLDEYDAAEINKAIKGLGTDEDALIEILLTRLPEQIKAMKEAYLKLFNTELEKDVRGDTSGNFKKVLVTQIIGGREQKQEYDLTQAQEDAQALFKAGEGKWGTDESKFNQVLCTRSLPHLRAMFEEYKKIAGKDIEESIKSEFSGDIKDSLITVVRVIKDKPLYFARKMHKSMKGMGTDDASLVRVVVSRCEVDMVQIKEAFKKEFNGDLAQWLKDDTSGDYLQLLLALIGERERPQPTAEEIALANEPQEIEEVEEVVLVEEPTLLPAEPFDPNADCDKLRKAMKGFGTDEDALIEVMAHRSNQQRMEIKKLYQTKFSKDLVKELKSETSGNFWLVLQGLCQTADEFDAAQLNKAVKGLGTDEDCLIEVLCTRSKEELEKIKATYKRVYQKTVEEDIVGDTSGHFKRLMVAMCQANRPEGNTVNRTKARKDAKAIYEAGENKMGTDESRFNVILCSRSYAQLRATFDEYQKAYNKDITEVIKSEFSGDIQKGMLTVVNTLRNKHGQFADTLHSSMAGLGTRDDKLIRTIVSRCEKDMVQIKEQYVAKHQHTLAEDIKGDTSGDYRNILLGLIGETASK